MKKRLISIFLIVSIVISVFAVSAVTTSAASIVRPSNVNVTTVGNNFRVSWTHYADDATQYYVIWVHNMRTDGRKSGNWKKFTSLRPKKGSFSQEIGSMFVLGNSGDTYEIKVSCHDEMGREDWYSNTVKRTFVSQPTLTKTNYFYKVATNKQENEFNFNVNQGKKPDYYVFWLQYKSNYGSKWSSWQQKKCSSTSHKFTFTSGYTYRIKVSAVINGFHSDYSNTYSIKPY